MKNIIELSGGATEDSWTGTAAGDIDAWAGEIFETAENMAALLPHTVRFDSDRTIHIPVTYPQSGDWVSGTTDAASSGTTLYDIKVVTLTPVKYRTLMPIQREAIELATWSIENDIRNRLARRTALKLDQICWGGFDDQVVTASTNRFQATGANLNVGTHVDYGTALSVDNIVDAIDGIREYNYNPNTIIIPASLHKDLLKESTFISAAEHGDRSVIESGKIARFLGCDVIISNNVPKDSDNATLGFVFDDTAAVAACVPHEFELESYLYWRTDNIEFVASFRADAKQLDGNAEAVLYT